ncbi:AbrB/MazE/SpoVT family DNA-binding domain-containing protein [Candidatus Pantoea multigeneris]|uniref:Antitoxin n=1 Tax=Candidatus Pantoea multigeneris TaxID=2608357 RepID=A0ABX0RGU6_9GAMM|nr:antitoxin [Pantoea multigeneris]NIF24546.1 antitoxin [Pantoea multigeneris]
MPLSRLRQQGGAVVLTIPGEIIASMGWRIGTELDVSASGEGVSITPLHRTARGRKTVSELLAGIDSEEIILLNQELSDELSSEPTGREDI